MTTQQDASVGIKKETTYGTGVVVDRHVEFTSVSLDYTPERLQGEGLRVSSRFARTNRRVTGRVMAGGDLEVEAFSAGQGILYAAALGSSTSTVTAVGSDAYCQVHKPASSDYLDSYTLQVGVPPLGGGPTIAHTFVGALCSQLKLTAAQGAILKVATSWMCRDMKTDTAYATPTYPSAGELFHFVEGTLIYGGTVTAPTTTALGSITGGATLAQVTDWNLTYDNHLDDAGYGLNGSPLRRRKNALGAGEISGSMTAEFDDVTLRDAWINRDQVAMMLTIAGNGEAIEDDTFPTLQILVPKVEFLGGLPQPDGGKVISTSISYVGLDDPADALAPIYITAITSDTAI